MGPHGGAIESADEFDATAQRLACQRTFVVTTILLGKVRRRKVVIGAADDLRDALHRIVQEKASIDPPIAALPVLDPGLNPFDLVEQACKSCCDRIEERLLTWRGHFSLFTEIR